MAGWVEEEEEEGERVERWGWRNLEFPSGLG